MNLLMQAFLKDKKPELTIDMVAKSRNHTIDSPQATDMRKKNITTSESLAMEGTKPENTIYLFRRGSFLRAYNGSAWLVRFKNIKNTKIS